MMSVYFLTRDRKSVDSDYRRFRQNLRGDYGGKKAWLNQIYCMKKIIFDKIRKNGDI